MTSAARAPASSSVIRRRHAPGVAVALLAMAVSSVALAALVLLALVGGCCGLDNGLGLTPPMGFNTWNHFG